MKKIIILGFLALLIGSMASCSSENSSSIVLEKAKERREIQNNKELFEGVLFFNREKKSENQPKQTILDEKEEVSDEFFDRSFKLVFFGDSLTQGVGDNTGNGGFTSFVKEHYASKPLIENVSVTNLGVRGNRTSHLLNRLKKPEVQESLQLADVIFITVGGNDLMKVIRENFLDLNFKLFEKEQVEYAERLTTVLTEVRELNPDSTIYLVGVFNPFHEFFKDIPEMNQVVENWNGTSAAVLANYSKTAFIPIQDIFIDSAEYLLGDDQFHPNDKGYRLIGDEIVKNIIIYNQENLLDADFEMLERE
ncbi:SGNH/GDSL hydrolase family protein [Sutcliffiella deserti]|uniref:SGNH/GDSL hydrolase family protein n=1 Tax=Sutcliffiella deserti TaxID=2875501 RepID=UPI001CBBC42F|nr:SGNH/GDSL hydrolase family protein [Sutcliffiella deserti]